jgi:hypothetical protein
MYAARSCGLRMRMGDRNQITDHARPHAPLLAMVTLVVVVALDLAASRGVVEKGVVVNLSDVRRAGQVATSSAVALFTSFAGEPSSLVGVSSAIEPSDR